MRETMEIPKYFYFRVRVINKGTGVKVEDASDVDVVEVVRCKDCKHNQLPPTSGNAECELWYGMTDVYGYCHYGERKEDGNKPKSI